MRLVYRALLLLVILGVVALLSFAIFSDLPAPSHEVSVPIEAR